MLYSKVILKMVSYSSVKDFILKYAKELNIEGSNKDIINFVKAIIRNKFTIEEINSN